MKKLPLVTKSLSDDALGEVKKWFKQDRINGNVIGYEGIYTYNTAEIV